MCGILLLITTESNGEFTWDPEIFDQSKIRSFLKRRGPDHYQCHDFQFEQFQFHLESSVLHLRGPEGSGNQPCQNTQGSFLQWNGQIFRIMKKDGQFTTLSDTISDTEELFRLLSQAEDSIDILEIFSSIHGPWSLTYWNNEEKKLWIGRDIIGRRSLCWNQNFRDKFLIISSVSCLIDQSKTKNILENLLSNLKFEEIPSDRIFCFNFKDYQKNNLIEIWNNNEQFYWSKNIVGFPVRPEICSILLQSPIRIQFNCLQPTEIIDRMLKECSGSTGFEIPNAICEQFIEVLSNSVRSRCQNYHYLINEEHPIIAILFSGGIDSTVLALLAHKFIEPVTRPIDLLNVAFDSRASDRQTGLDAWKELYRLFPQRQWNFIEINVDSDELNHYRYDHICYLIEPNKTVMDDSIGCALWFATRGQGFLYQNPNNINEKKEYRTSARIVLIGMGADEQLGGYSRHRQAFQSGHWTSLLLEIRRDIERIAGRNLGRDDRVTADHGIEARLPYLDEMVIDFLNNLPVWIKCNPYLSRGYGEKWLLRKVAQRLGLEKSCHNLKRAIQFGSKITRHQPNVLKGEDLMIKLKLI